MLTDKQVTELESLLKERRKNNGSLRIADVTKVIYPVDEQTRQHKIKTATH